MIGDFSSLSMIQSINPKSIGSVGRYNPIFPLVNSSKLTDKGVKKTVSKNAKEVWKIAMYAIAKASGNAFKK